MMKYILNKLYNYNDLFAYSYGVLKGALNYDTQTMRSPCSTQ